ncbi:MAG: hypothetical protein R3F56_15905 [Planctomycetota bacterium]
MSEALLGQGEEFASLLRAARELRLHHGFLLEGPAGSGKTTAALALALALLDDGESSVAIEKQVMARQHPDLHWLAPPKDKSDIPVDLVRELQAGLACRAYGERARVAIIDPAEHLNEQGQNALLKTLEEPGEAAFLLLVTSRPEGLLPTVRSRVGRYRLRPLSPEAVAEALARLRPQADPALRAWAVEVARGSLGFAQDLVDEPRAHELYARFVDCVRSGNAEAHDLVAQCLADVNGREAVEARAALVLRLLQAALAATLEDIAEGDVSTLAFADGATYRLAALDRWIESCERVFETEVDVRLHIAVEQALLGLFLELNAPC